MLNFHAVLTVVSRGDQGPRRLQKVWPVVYNDVVFTEVVTAQPGSDCFARLLGKAV